MSRVGKSPVALPKGVEAKLDGRVLRCKGPKGELVLDVVPGIDITVEGEELNVTRASEEKEVRAMHGTVRALIANMVHGVSEGYVRKLEVVGVGYRAQLQGQKLVLNVGFCHPVEIEAPEGVSFNCPDQTHIEVSGIDKQAVGQAAAFVRRARPPEPYKGKGIRFEGEQIRRKEGKQGK